MILQVMKSLSKSISLIHPLQPGDRLTRAEFERRFDLTRNLKRAELIEGVVYIPPPIGPAHGSKHAELGTWLGNYRTATPGTVSTITSSIRLDLDNEPQPDLALMIASEFGGNCRIDEDNFLFRRTRTRCGNLVQHSELRFASEKESVPPTRRKRISCLARAR